MNCRECDHLYDCKRQCRALPEGKKCGDCLHYSLCSKIYSAKTESPYCLRSPNRFVDGKAGRV